MQINTKDMVPLGFKGGGMFDDSKWHMHYYKKVPEKLTVYIINSITPQGIYHYKLTSRQYKAFEAGKLGLTPKGCCGGYSGGKYLEDPKVDFEGDFDEIGKKKVVLEFIKKIVEE